MRGSAYPTNTNDFGPSLVGLPLWPCDDLAECRFTAGMVQVARLGLTDPTSYRNLGANRRPADRPHTRHARARHRLGHPFRTAQFRGLRDPSTCRFRHGEPNSIRARNPRDRSVEDFDVRSAVSDQSGRLQLMRLDRYARSPHAEHVRRRSVQISTNPPGPRHPKASPAITGRGQQARSKARSATDLDL